MSSIVAVAGGSHGLGRAIVEALKKDSHYVPLILSRKSDPKLKKEIRVRILKVEYSDTDSLVNVLEENRVNTVISTILKLIAESPEFNLIEAADHSKTTHRFVPSVWSAADYKDQESEQNPIARQKLRLKSELSKTALEWTAIHPGTFLEYYCTDLPTNINPVPMYVNVQGNSAAIPGSGDYPVPFTYSEDIAKYTAALLSLNRWDKKYFIVGNTKSWKELIALAERIRGVKFNVAYNSFKKLKQGKVTELKGYKKIYDLFGGEPGRQAAIAVLAHGGLWFKEGLLNYSGAKFLNDLFPQIKPLSVEQGLKICYKE